MLRTRVLVNIAAAGALGLVAVGVQAQSSGVSRTHSRYGTRTARRVAGANSASHMTYFHYSGRAAGHYTASATGSHTRYIPEAPGVPGGFRKAPANSGTASRTGGNTRYIPEAPGVPGGFRSAQGSRGVTASTSGRTRYIPEAPGVPGGFGSNSGNSRGTGSQSGRTRYIPEAPGVPGGFPSAPRVPNRTITGTNSGNITMGPNPYPGTARAMAVPGSSGFNSAQGGLQNFNSGYVGSGFPNGGLPGNSTLPFSNQGFNGAGIPGAGAGSVPTVPNTYGNTGIAAANPSTGVQPTTASPNTSSTPTSATGSGVTAGGGIYLGSGGGSYYGGGYGPPVAITPNGIQPLVDPYGAAYGFPDNMSGNMDNGQQSGYSDTGMSGNAVQSVGANTSYPEASTVISTSIEAGNRLQLHWTAPADSNILSATYMLLDANHRVLAARTVHGQPGNVLMRHSSRDVYFAVKLRMRDGSSQVMMSKF